MKGQWKGRYRGTNSGLIVVELDDEGDHLHGLAELFDDDSARPWSLALLGRTPKQGPFSTAVDIAFANPKTALIISAADAQGLVPNVAFPDRAVVNGDWTPAGLKLSWVTAVGSKGSASYGAAEASKDRDIAPKQK